MASNSGHGDGDKGKRPLSGATSPLSCFKPESSQNSSEQRPQALVSASASASTVATALASTVASASAQLRNLFPRSKRQSLFIKMQGAGPLTITPIDTRKRIGKGKYGHVYEGSVKNRWFTLHGEPYMFGRALIGERFGFEEWTPAACKVVNRQGMQVIRGWLEMVMRCGNLASPRFVRLITATEFHSDMLGKEVTVLVYEFMPNRSLKDCLFRSPCLLTWELRANIALHAAEGLLFLHERKVTYGDFKASNILLDKDFKARLSFFGQSQSRKMNNGIDTEEVDGYIEAYTEKDRTNSHRTLLLCQDYKLRFHSGVCNASLLF